MHVGNGEFMLTLDVAIAMRKVTAEESERLARAASEIARTRPSRKLTYAHQVNLLKMLNALFMKECRCAAESYLDIATDNRLFGSMTAILVRGAACFDVIVTTIMFGDILSYLAS